MPASRKVNKLTAIRKRKVRNLFEKPVCFTVIWIVIYVEFMLFWVYQALFFLMFFYYLYLDNRRFIFEQFFVANDFIL